MVTTIQFLLGNSTEIRYLYKQRYWCLLYIRILYDYVVPKQKESLLNKISMKQYRRLTHLILWLNRESLFPIRTH